MAKPGNALPMWFSMRSTCCVYSVFHEAVYPDNYRGYTPEELRDWFRLYAVNEPVAKAIPEGAQLPPVVKEWELPWHDPVQQMTKMYNNSALWHVWRNAESLPDTDFVGFAQYDMTIPRDSLRDFINMGAPSRVGYLFPYAWTDFRLDEALPLEFWETLLRSTRLPVSLDQLMAGLPAPLMHGLILPRAAFDRMMQWLDGVKGLVVRRLGHDVRHLAGTLERAIAVWVAAHVHCGRLGPVCRFNNCVHSESQRLSDEYRGV